MSVSITLSQVRSVIDQGDGRVKYRVANQIVAAANLTLALFVNDVDPDDYSHIASLYDLNAYPEDRNEAINLGLDYYRRSDATQDYDSIDDAVHFAAVVKQQLAYLAPVVAAAQGTFPSTEVTTFTA
jgi:hypothetical protein